jgi:hypothetical protein
MTGIQPPSRPTETPLPHPVDLDRMLAGSPTSGPARPRAGSHVVLFLVVVVALAVTVVGLTVTIVSVIMDNTRLRAEALRLADDVEGLAAEDDQLTAQQAQAADGFAAWFGEEERWEEPPAEPLLEGTVTEEVVPVRGRCGRHARCPRRRGVGDGPTLERTPERDAPRPG